MVVQPRRIVRETPGQRAWRHLREGFSRTAYNEFALIVRRDPANARARLGFAVAAYRIEHKGEAVLALRAAFNTDPAIFRGFSCSHSVRRDLLRIRSEATSVSYGRIRAKHGYFTIAATSYLLGDIRAARNAIVLAVRHGDRKTATLKLARVLRIRVS